MDWSTDLNRLADQIAEWRSSKNFITPSSLASEYHRDLMLGKLMLVVTEIAEAAEAVRHQDMDNFEEEIADTFIRLLDISGTMKLNIVAAIHDKMNKNAERPERHGKHTSL